MKQQNHLKKKRGVTLYELVIVMLLTALISGLVISFSVFLSDYIDKANDMNRTVGEVSTARRAVERWFSYFDSPDYRFVIKQSETDYTATLGKEVYTLSAENIESGESYSVDMFQSEKGRCIFLSYPEETIELLTDGIVCVSFTHLDKSGLYRCDVQSGEDNVLHFLLVSRV